MKLLLLIPLVTLLLSSCTTTSTGWVYVGNNKVDQTTEGKLFEEHHRYCDHKLKLAKDTVKEYKLSADPKGAYEHCMLSKGWQQVSVN